MASLSWSPVDGESSVAFAVLPVSDSADYDAIKAAILVRYDINEDAYKNRIEAEGRRNQSRVGSTDDGLVDQVAQLVQDSRPDSSGLGDRAVLELAPSGEEAVAGGAEAKDVPLGW